MYPQGLAFGGTSLNLRVHLLEVSNWCSYFDGMSPYPRKFVIPIILEKFDLRSFLLPEFNMHLLKSATLLFGKDSFFLLES